MGCNLPRQEEEIRMPRKPSPRPFQVAVQGAKPRKGERVFRRFGSLEAAARFAAEQQRASWAGLPWMILNVETWDRWEVGDHHSKIKQLV